MYNLISAEETIFVFCKVIFCSEECRDLAARYHPVECPMIDNLEDSLQLCIRVDILRLISKHPAVLLRDMLPKLNEIVNLHEKGQSNSQCLLRVLEKV